MPHWNEKIDLNGVIGRTQDAHDLSRVEEDCPEEVKAALAAEVHKSKWLAHFAPELREAKSIAEVNRIMDRIYDAADKYRVWCGLG